MTQTQSPGTTTREYSNVEYVFEPNSTTLPPTREYLRDLWERRRFMAALAKADLQGPRKSTLLGELWGVIDPLFQAGIYWFLITVIRGRGASSGNYLSLVVSSIFLFNFTRIALAEGGRSIVKGKGLMLNSTFPRALLPIASVYKGLLEFIPSALLYIPIHLALGRPIGQGLFLLPLLFLFQVALSMGLALIFSTLTVYIRDMSNLLNYVLRILTFITPVIYPYYLLSSSLRSILVINPLFALFTGYQTIVLGGVPSFSIIFQAGAWSVLLLVVGARLFISHERSFALRL